MASKNKVYYGEYTLKHWVDLILKREISLPLYQRTFVWRPEQIRELIGAIKEGDFVPPVIIGSVQKDGVRKDIILDGQQRLTSILFAYIGKHIDIGKYCEKHKSMPEVFDDNEEADDDFKHQIGEWTFNKIIVNDGKCDNVQLEKEWFIGFEDFVGGKEEFLNNNYLGFCYVVPDATTNSESAQSACFSRIFRTLNTSGTILTVIEQRQSLYFLKDSLNDYFDPDFVHGMIVKSKARDSKRLDFVKYLSLCSHYKATSDIKKYGSRPANIEKFYEDYIFLISAENVVGNADFDLSDYSDRLPRVKETIEKLRIPLTFNTTIEADVFFFGLIYFSVFLDKEIILKPRNHLRRKLTDYIKDAHDDQAHIRNPAKRQNVLDRLKKSIEIYGGYVAADAEANAEHAVIVDTEE